MSNLRLINETTLSSSVSTLSVTDVFSADYDIYKITMNDFSTASSTATETFLRFINSSGSVINSGSLYARGDLYMPADTGFSEIRSTGDDEIHYAVGTLDDSPQGGSAVHYIFNPYSSSNYTFNINQNSSFYSNPRFLANKGIGVLKQTSSITGFQIVFDISNANAGVCRTYGLRVDS